MVSSAVSSSYKVGNARLPSLEGADDPARHESTATRACWSNRALDQHLTIRLFGTWLRYRSFPRSMPGVGGYMGPKSMACSRGSSWCAGARQSKIGEQF